MRLKTLPLLILLTLLLIPASFAETPPASPESFGNAYGIEPEKSYPGSTVLRLVEVAEEELLAAIDEAYAKGYKAAAVSYAPEAALYKELARNMEAAIAAERKKNRSFWPVVGISAGLSFAAGFLCSFLIAGR
ncbi:MAG: hypothetical protein LBO80_07235 [Treponema sp.]|jgi:hypothetical protein|nr:hypothetical protein [Treponema sp.]